MKDECENLEKCSFFNHYQTHPSKQLALKGFVNLYCKGRKMDVCIRKQICHALGGAEHVPKNMMPNGRALEGTSNDNWEEPVIDVLEKLNVRVFRPRAKLGQI